MKKSLVCLSLMSVYLVGCHAGNGQNAAANGNSNLLTESTNAAITCSELAVGTTFEHLSSSDGKVHTYLVIDNSNESDVIIKDGRKVDRVCTSHVTNMSAWFSTRRNSPDVKEWDLSDWDTSNVTDMTSMFEGCRNGCNPEISNWNTKNVKDMKYMFANSDFNQSLNKWSVSNVTSMERMFMMNQSFNQALNNWDTSKVTNMDGMFAYTTFNQDISQWNVDNVSSWNAFNLAGMLAEENTPKFKDKR